MTRSPTARLLLIGCTLMAGAAHAQVFRNVGPDGRVSYTDQPATSAARAQPGTSTLAPPTTGTLPYQLAQTAQRYPVTLYSSADCTPCNAGRNLLVNRGIPFTERTVDSADDAAALQRLAGDNKLPLVTIGQQQLKGFADVEWTQYLDAAGYPKSSQLPGSYRRPAATPLVAVRAAPAGTPPAAEAPAPTAAEPSIAPPRTVTNPNAIRF